MMEASLGWRTAASISKRLGRSQFLYHVVIQATSVVAHYILPAPCTAITLPCRYTTFGCFKSLWNGLGLFKIGLILLIGKTGSQAKTRSEDKKPRLRNMLNLI